MASTQGFVELHAIGEPPVHAPPLQASPVVHNDPSSQGFALGVNTQPDAGLHESVVHGFASKQVITGPGTQRPDMHVSPEVHRVPSSQGPVTFVVEHPVAGTQTAV